VCVCFSFSTCVCVSLSPRVCVCVCVFLFLHVCVCVCVFLCVDFPNTATTAARRLRGTVRDPRPLHPTARARTLAQLCLHRQDRQTDRQTDDTLFQPPAEAYLPRPDRFFPPPLTTPSSSQLRLGFVLVAGPTSISSGSRRGSSAPPAPANAAGGASVAVALGSDEAFPLSPGGNPTPPYTTANNAAEDDATGVQWVGY
jgi:hypothetical protein